MALHDPGLDTRPAYSGPGWAARGAPRAVNRLAGAALFAASVLCGSVAAADEPHHTGRASGFDDFIETYRWGISEYETDDFTKVTGWRLGDSWHFGYKEGKGSGFSLVWQADQDQMSFSTDGIRYTHRF